MVLHHYNFNVFFILCVCLMYPLCTVCTRQYDWGSSLSKNINGQIKPSLIVIFGDNNVSNRVNLLKRTDAPFINVQSSVETLTNSQKMAIFNVIHFKHSTSPYLFVIFESGKSIVSMLFGINNLLNFIIWLFPLVPRPKCLLVLLTDANVSLVDYINQILVHAWRLKFLDFSVITANEATNSEIFHYNPFSNSLSTTSLTTDAQIFPDKLKNMHAYVLKFPVINNPPCTIVTNDSDTLNIRGYYYPYFEIFAKMLNFTLDVLANDWQLNTLSMSTNKSRIISLFNNDEIDGMTIPTISYSFIEENRLTTVGHAFFPIQIGIAVPIIKAHTFELPLEFAVILIILIVLVPFVHLGARLANLPRFDYAIIDVYQNFLGLTAFNNPTRTIGKISLTSIFLVHLLLSGEIFSRLTSVRLINNELVLDTFEQIDEANLTVQIPYYYEMIANNCENAALQNLLKDALTILDPQYCFSELPKTTKYACVAPVEDIEYYVKQQSLPPTMKLSKAILYSDFAGYYYQKASPYEARFSGLQLRIMEVGLFKFQIPLWGYGQPNSTYRFDEYSDEQNESRLAFSLMIVAITGFSLALVTLVVELSCSRFFKA